jgi:hypothetical protein
MRHQQLPKVCGAFGELPFNLGQGGRGRRRCAGVKQRPSGAGLHGQPGE